MLNACAMGRVLGLHANTEVKTVTIAPNEEVPREICFEHSGIIAVRRGLAATATCLDSDKGLFYSDIAGPGSVIGLASILKDAPSYDYIVSLDEAVLCLSDKDSLLGSCVSQAGLKELLAATYNVAGRSARLSWVRMGSSVRQRTERLLSEMVVWLLGGQASELLTLAVSHSTIAQIIGAERRNVTKSLTLMSEEGLVECARRSITLKPAFYAGVGHSENPWANDTRKPFVTADNLIL